MDKQSLRICGEVLSTLTEHFSKIPENKREALQAAAVCTVAHSYVVELAVHLANGMEPYDACVATVEGTLEIPPSAATVFALLGATPKE